MSLTLPWNLEDPSISVSAQSEVTATMAVRWIEQTCRIVPVKDRYDEISQEYVKLIHSRRVEGAQLFFNQHGRAMDGETFAILHALRLSGSSLLLTVCCVDPVEYREWFAMMGISVVSRFERDLDL